MTRRELKLLAKLDEMVVKSQTHGTGKGYYDGKQGRRRESERGRPSPARAVSEKISASGARCDVCCSRNDEDGGFEDGKLVVSLVVHYAT